MIIKPLKAKVFGALFGFPEYSGCVSTKYPLGKLFYTLMGYPRRVQREFSDSYLHGYMDVHHSGKLGLLRIWCYALYHSSIKFTYNIHTPNFDTRLKYFGVCDTEIGGVDSTDYPKFCDAYYESAVWNDTMENLTDDELELLGPVDSQDAYETLL